MKKLIILFVLFIKSVLLFAQVPQSLNYQGVARNASNQVQANKTMKVRLSVRAGSAAGTVKYSETRTITTNANGLFNVVIGSAGATTTTGSFASIDWLSASHFLQTELDVNNNNTFTNLGTVQMQSTPYAMAAGTANGLKLPFAATGNQAGDMLNILNNSGSAISGDGRGASSVGVKGATDLNIGVMGISYGSGVGVLGNSNTGNAGKFSVPAANTKSAVEIEHKGAGNALKASSVGGHAIQANSTGQGVGISATTDNNIAVLATSNNTGTAVYGSSSRGHAANFVTQSGNSNATVKSQSLGNGIAVQGISEGGFGLQGISTSNIGVRGSSTSGTGVVGVSTSSNGVSGSSTTGTGVVGASNSGVGVLGSSVSGTAARFTAPSTARALDVDGPIRITNVLNPAGRGKVLTSDANGNATWQGAIAFKTNGVVDEVLGSVQQDFVVNSAKQPVKVKFNTVNMNFGGHYANNQFTAPFDGIYHFNTSILWAEQTAVLPLETVRIAIIREDAQGNKEYLATAVRTNLTESQSMQLAVDTYIFAGNKVYIEATAFSPDLIPKRIIDNDPWIKGGTWFSGHLITKM